MELLVTLSEISYVKVLSQFGIDGVIAGSFGSFRYHYTLDELKRINSDCKEKNLKLYISIDAFLTQNDRPSLYLYLEELRNMNVAGIYFHDFAVWNAARSFNMENLLIYDGGPVLSSSLDCAFYLNSGLNGVVLARELTMDEILKILENYKNQVDMQVFGHLRMSYSKRKFLTNYFKEIEKEFDPLDYGTITLRETQRDYKMPIVENNMGTQIYTDYIFECIEEFPYLSKLLKRAIIDDLFIGPKELHEVLRTYVRVNNTNVENSKGYLYESVKTGELSNGYLYEKTNILKDEE